MISLVIFTCEGREHLLSQTINSFRKHFSYNWTKVILAVDGQVNPQLINEIKPDVILQHPQRSGYVNSISTTLKTINTPYFFWLEDDWTFHSSVALETLAAQLENHQDWAEIMLSKTGPLTQEEKINPLMGNFFNSIYGFSANPCLCNTKQLQDGFFALELAPKGGQLGQDGFENFLTKKFSDENIKTVVLDPVDQFSISHEGYLETTPRKWHMTNSLEGAKTQEHLMTIPVPPFWRRVTMVFKLIGTFFKLFVVQLYNNKIYEFCFRVVASAQSTLKNKD
ncbi:hypothetical protein J7E50_24060 [Pedobacter sp. ISL-68]|uniref:hypothetical protein n=1 Tax=unclassified Pedobacter TaxID=2628915 RepID=UPI001BE7C858|nr:MULTISPECIES: hypothetical protein [unclassified Pedobacter]MBT2562803.1 hypothetical protein [Pedobacter sp. ISL-64]MBT2593316.1 hypothetical protein [Pedobacter sp. ISL-68]